MKYCLVFTNPVSKRTKIVGSFATKKEVNIAKKYYNEFSKGNYSIKENTEFKRQLQLKLNPAFVANALSLDERHKIMDLLIQFFGGWLKQRRPKREECKYFNKIRGCTSSRDESIKCNEKKMIIDKFVKELTQK